MISTRILLFLAIAGHEICAQSLDPQLAPNPDYSLFQREPIDQAGSISSALRNLINNPSPRLFMAVAPCFDEPFTIVLSQSEVPKSKGPQFILEFSKRIGKPHRHGQVRRIRATIPPEFATAIHEAWDAVIRNAEYPDRPDPKFVAIDNDMFFFYAASGMSGITYSPRVPIVHLGQMLIDYIESPQNERVERMSLCIKLADEIKVAQIEFRARRSKP